MAGTEQDDGLTDEERAALDLEDKGAAFAGGEGGDGGDGNDNGDGNEEGGGKGDGGAAAGDGSDGAAAAGGDTQPAGEAGGEPAAGQQSGPTSESAPILVVQPPADAEVKLAEIATKKEELLTKFDDGDITAKEYQKEIDALNKQELDIKLDIREAKLAEKMEIQRQANEWKATIDQFIVQNPRYNPEKSEAMYKLLDLEVRRVAMTDEFKNRTDSAAGREILQKAHENLAEQLGFEAKPQAKKDGDGKQQIKKPDLPPSLDKLPAAEQNDTSGGKYAVLDRLANTDPIRYEEELMKLPDAERNAYLVAA